MKWLFLFCFFVSLYLFIYFLVENHVENIKHFEKNKEQMEKNRKNLYLKIFASEKPVSDDVDDDYDDDNDVLLLMKRLTNEIVSRHVSQLGLLEVLTTTNPRHTGSKI